MSAAATLVKRIRERERVSQYELARRSKVAQSTISRIESGELDPSWSTISALLDGAGWTAEFGRTDAASLIPTTRIVREMRTALARADEASALRSLAEATGRILRTRDREIPAWATADSGTTGDQKWDTILATALAHAVSTVGATPERWMTDAPALDVETVLGSADPAPAYRDMIREQTPAIFREKNILSRERDWVTA